MADAFRFEGYVIVSQDGMIAAADGTMPEALIVPADQDFFERGLDRTDLVVHGRHSQESHARSAGRRRVIATHRVPGLAAGDTPHSILWNPQGTSFENAAAALGTTAGRVGVIGGTQVFGLFLPRYAAFHLSRVAGLHLPGGRPVFPGVPAQSPEAILRRHGYRAGPERPLDPARGASVTTWEPEGNFAR